MIILEAFFIVVIGAINIYSIWRVSKLEQEIDELKVDVLKFISKD